MGFGANQNVHVANASGDTIYVMPSPNRDWLITDIVVDIGLMFVGLGELKAAYTAATMPKTLATIWDVFRTLKIAAGFASGTIASVSRSSEAAYKFIEAFKQSSMAIESGDFKNVMDQGFFGTFFNASGYAGFLGASTVSLIIMSGDGRQVAIFNTAPDDSWIATERQVIVRSKYGTLWQEDPDAGMKNWALSNGDPDNDE